MKKIVTVFLLVISLIACNETKKVEKETKTIEKEQKIAAVYKSVEFDIEGMTCQIGCAKSIESKVSKMEGVTFSKVSFEDKKGLFTYDTNKLSVDDLTKKIEGIAGGDLYKVTDTKEIQEVIEVLK